MKKWLLVAFVVLGIGLLVLQKPNVGLYQVVEIYDGDTIAVAMGGRIEKIRMIGVDTPETHDPRKPVQCYGPEASDYSHATLANAKVRLEADPLSTNRDRYDRLLRYVYLPDGTLYNKTLLEQGYARAYTGFPFTKSQQFIDSNVAAKQQNKGLWGACTTLAV